MSRLTLSYNDDKALIQLATSSETRSQVAANLNAIVDNPSKVVGAVVNSFINEAKINPEFQGEIAGTVATMVAMARLGGGITKESKINNTIETVTKQTNRSSNKGSIPNMKTSATRIEAEQALTDNGYTGISKGGKNNVTIYSKEGKNTKVIRDNASSTGGSTIDILNDKNKAIRKIRLDEK